MRQLDFYLLIPCYNNLTGLRRSLASVEYPSVKYGIVIVDDGSDYPVTRDALGNDLPTATIILRHDSNAGITAALNTGLTWLEQRNDYRHVARLDCGDVCSAVRFHRQVGFLEDHPGIDLLGSWVRFKNFSTGFSYRYRTPVSHERIQRGMHFRNLFIHPSVMWRAEVLTRINRYPYDLPHAEDYGFFYQILGQGRTAILPEELTVCEISSRGLSLLNRRQQLRSRMKAVLRYRKSNVLAWLGLMKLQLLMWIPGRMALAIKSFFF
jgi:glycosyltransferase involved in cell wall biosynthesis